VWRFGRRFLRHLTQCRTRSGVQAIVRVQAKDKGGFWIKSHIQSEFGARIRGKGSCFYVYNSYIMYCNTINRIVWLFSAESWYFCEILGICPETAWWACRCRQAAHQYWPSSGHFWLSCLAVGGIPPGGSYGCYCFTCFSWISSCVGGSIRENY